MSFDPSDEKLAAIVKRLRDDEVAWLVTVHEGAPRPVPVWFLWDGNDRLLVYSSASALKVKSIQHHPEVAFHFNSTEQGGEIAILYGRMERTSGLPSLLDNRDYMRKYDGPLKSHARETGTTPEAISAEFHVPLVMAIERAHGW
jgi:PPOX class probable F420-dependent enzyme